MIIQTLYDKLISKQLENLLQSFLFLEMSFKTDSQADFGWFLRKYLRNIWARNNAYLEAFHWTRSRKIFSQTILKTK